MSDGKKWAAEQDELESEERYKKELRRREDLLIKKFSDATRRAFVTTFISRIDEMNSIWRELRMGERSMRYEDHVRAREFKRLLDDLKEETIK